MSDRTSVSAGRLTRMAEATGALVGGPVRTALRHRMGRFRPGELSYAPTPPPIPAGTSPGPPDVVVVGAGRSETRAVFDLVTAFTGMAAPVDAEALSAWLVTGCTAPFGERDVAEFHRWFPRAPGQRTAHWSPDGLVHPWVVPLLATAAPGAKVVVVLVDPIEQLRVRLHETLDQRAAHVGSYLADAVDRGLYADQLAHLHRHVDPADVYVVQAERLATEPVAGVAAIQRFVGVEEGPLPVPWRPSVVAPLHPVTSDPRTEERVRALYTADVSRLVASVKDLDLSLWPGFAG